MIFLENTNEKDIFNALMCGEKSITIDNIEIILKSLKRDTMKNREIEAKVMTNNILKLL